MGQANFAFKHVKKYRVPYYDPMEAEGRAMRAACADLSYVFEAG